MGYINFYFIPKHGVAPFSCTIPLGSSVSHFPNNLERLLCAGWINQDAHAYPDQEYSNMSGMGGLCNHYYWSHSLKAKGFLETTWISSQLVTRLGFQKNFPPSWCTPLVINHSELDLQMDLTVFSMPGHNPVQHQHNAFLPLHNTEQQEMMQ